MFIVFSQITLVSISLAAKCFNFFFIQITILKRHLSDDDDDDDDILSIRKRGFIYDISDARTHDVFHSTSAIASSSPVESRRGSLRCSFYFYDLVPP